MLERLIVAEAAINAAPLRGEAIATDGFPVHRCGLQTRARPKTARSKIDRGLPGITLLKKS
jgi:hypothetical protein